MGTDDDGLCFLASLAIVDADDLRIDLAGCIFSESDRKRGSVIYELRPAHSSRSLLWNMFCECQQGVCWITGQGRAERKEGGS